MRTWTIRVGMIGVSLALAFGIGGPSLAGLAEERIQEALSRSGRLERLRQFPLRVLAALRQTDTVMEQRYQAKLAEAFIDAYDAEAVERLFVTTVASHVDAETVRVVLAWYETPLGQRVAALETAQLLHDSPADDGDRSTDERHRPFSAARLRQVQRLEQALRSREVGDEFAVSTALALTTAMNAILPPHQQIDSRLIRQALEQEHQSMRAAREREAVQGLLLLYRGLSDREFERYVDFVESRHGRKFYHGVRTALRHVLTQTSHDLGLALGMALREISRLQGV